EHLAANRAAAAHAHALVFDLIVRAVFNTAEAQRARIQPVFIRRCRRADTTPKRQSRMIQKRTVEWRKLD
ncbi:hypothetical protein QZH36_21250, partial [Erwinia sp. BC051422]|uniref:hypothetical protein n=1 Tax=Erwinia wuhanensis TaxID=3045167 RepID=UPI00264E8C8B